jgi:hypothetical protein
MEMAGVGFAFMLIFLPKAFGLSPAHVIDT